MVKLSNYEGLYMSIFQPNTFVYQIRKEETKSDLEAELIFMRVGGWR